MANAATGLEDRVRRLLVEMAGEPPRQARTCPPDLLRRARRGVALTLVSATVLAAGLGVGVFRGIEALSRPAIPASQGPQPGATQTVWETLHRTLHFPVLSPEAACPSSDLGVISPPAGTGFSRHVRALGRGPVYAVSGRDSRVVRMPADARTQDGWYALKTVWLADPHASGPLLVRGARIDGPGEVGFGTRQQVDAELRLTTAASASESGWRSWPSLMFVRSPGCYAVQIDGLDFTEVLVFRAVS